MLGLYSLHVSTYGAVESSSVASFLLLGGGGGGKPPKCSDRKKNHVHVTYMRERANASEIYRPIF